LTQYLNLASFLRQICNLGTAEDEAREVLAQRITSEHFTFQHISGRNC